MGTVYKAWHPRLNIHVALKTIQDTRLEGHDLLDRFKLEGQALVKLRHQNIVQIYDAAEANGIHFIVMEYVNGPGLDQLISKRVDLPLAKKIGYVIPICQALDHAHKRRLFHRDIKPANIMLQHDGNEEVVKVVDFGIARLLDFSQTSTNMFLGAPAYMAPELLCASDRANEKTDIWALGVTIYELIAYQRPFEGKSLEELKRKIVEGEPLPLSQKTNGCPEALMAIVDRMLARSPSERYQMIEDVLLDLEPVARRLRTDTAAALMRRAHEYYEIGDFDAAKVTLNEAKQYDPSNTHIKALMQKIQDELHRMELIPRLQGHLKRGKEFLQAGSFREAREEAEAALGLDSKFEPAHKLLSEIEQGVARVQLVEQKIRLGKQRLSEGSLTQAEELLIEVEGMEVIHPQLQELKRQISEERKRREQRKRLNQLLNQARGLLAGLDFEECQAVVQQALKEFPGEPELRKLQEAARTELAELEKQRAKQREIGECRALVAKEEFDAALVRLGQLAKLYPADSVIKDLRDMAEEGAQLQKRRRRLESGIAELRDLLATGDYKEVVARGEGLLREFPKDRGIQDLINFAVTEIVQEELKQKQALQANHIRDLLNAGDYEGAESAAGRAAQEFPANLNFAALLADAIRLKKKRDEQKELEREVERRRVERARREKEERRINDIRALTARGDLTGAAAMLEETISQGILSARDERTKLLRSEIEEKKRLTELRAQQDRQRKESEQRCIATIRELMDQGDFRTASQMLFQSVQERNLSPANEQVKELQAQIEAQRQQAELRKQQEMRLHEEHERLLEVAAGLIDRDEWDEGAKILKSVSSESITSAQAARIEQLHLELQEKRRYKEFLRRAEQRRRADQERRLEEIANLIRKNDALGAGQILSHALSEELLEAADERVKKLQAEIDERARQLEARRREHLRKAEAEAQRNKELEELKLSEVRTLAERGDYESATRLFVEVTETGMVSPADPRALRLSSQLEEGKRRAELRREEELRKKELEGRQLSSIRSQFTKGDHEGALRALTTATKSEALPENDERVVALRNEIEQTIQIAALRKEEEKRRFAHELKHKTFDIRGAMVSRDYPAAIKLAEEFERVHGVFPEITSLREKAEKELETEKSLRQKREEVLKQATDSLNHGDYGATLLLIDKNLSSGILTKGDMAVADLIDKAAEKKAEEKERKNQLLQRKREGVDRARRLLATNSFDECLSLLEGLQREFPGDAEISDLARAAESSQKKRQQLERIKTMVDRRELREARKQLGLLLKEYPQDAETRNLQESLQREEAQERRKALVEEQLHSMQRAFEANKLDEAIRLGVIALRNFPDEPRFGEILERAKLAKKKEQLEKTPKAAAAEAGVGGSGDSATDIGRNPLKEEAAREALPVANAPVSQGEALHAVERVLAALIGPLAILIVKRARISSGDPKIQLDLIAAALHADADRERFLMHREEVLAWLRALPSIEGHALNETTIFLPKHGGKIDSESVAEVVSLLTKYLGPISKVLVEKTARQADSLESLYRMLAEHLTNKEEREQFLAEGGFPE